MKQVIHKVIKDIERKRLEAEFSQLLKLNDMAFKQQDSKVFHRTVQQLNEVATRLNQLRGN